jgi:hypothetical protein
MVMEYISVGLVISILGGCPDLSHFQQPMYFEGRLFGPNVLVKHVPPRVDFPIYLGDRIVIPSPTFGFIGIISSNTDIPFAGLCHEVFLGATDAGAFAAGFDLQMSIVNSGSGVRLMWWGANQNCVSLRLDVIRGRISLTLDPDLDN